MIQKSVTGLCHALLEGKRTERMRKWTGCETLACELPVLYDVGTGNDPGRPTLPVGASEVL